MLRIRHEPIIKDYERVEELYSEKDGVDVKYVCTSTIPGRSTLQTYDIFFRETPHPQFGNRYFGLWVVHNLLDKSEEPKLYIGNADPIDNEVFAMIYDSHEDEWIYSRHRHDYQTAGGSVIDGGRAYIRGNGYHLFRLTDGIFEKETE